MLRTLGWACYLACSWTWCIGMFLPVLLLRDFGVWGFVAFAVPNVIGATAVGWLVRDGDHSRALRTAHSRAYGWFTVVTVAFHAYVLASFVGLSGSHDSDAEIARIEFEPRIWIPVGIFAGAAILVAFIKRARRAAAATWLVSAAIAVFFLFRDDPTAATSGARGPELLPLALSTSLGFLTCPLLDQTLIRPQRVLRREQARGAFAIGFPVLFLAMIVLTAAYAPALLAAMAGDASALSPGLALVMTHIAMQSLFTCSAHAAAHLSTQDGAEQDDLKTRFAFPRLIVVAATALLIPAILAVVMNSLDVTYAGLSAFEIGYRCFLAAYGLVFPAYVWVCMAPSWREPKPPTLRQLVAAGLSVVVAAPFFWMGFIERQTWFLAPGVAIVLLARLAVGRTPKSGL